MEVYVKNIVERSLEKVKFDCTDFTVSRKPGKIGGGVSTISICEINELLVIYVKNVLGENDRKKATSRKVTYVEKFLTSSGTRKLSDARCVIRMSIRNDVIQKERIDDGSVRVWDTELVKDIGVNPSETQEEVEQFIIKIHSWGESPENDRKYYLHMVFRYYLNRYHSKAYRMGIVLEYPSYQTILDIISPNGCATRFPSEFRRFLVDTEGRTFKMETLPIPVKGSGTDVKYDYNFELIPEVTSMRKKISSTFIRWEELLHEGTILVYPRYLHAGDTGNKCIRLAVSNVRTCEVIRKAMGKMKNISEESMYKILEEIPGIGDVYMSYMARRFSSPGEQLRERIGFFMMYRIRSMFSYVKKHGVLDDIFENNDVSTGNYVPFDNFCTTDRHLPSVEKDSSMTRSLLMLLVDVSFMFYALKNKKLGEMDPPSILRDAIKEIEN